MKSLKPRQAYWISLAVVAVGALVALFGANVEEPEIIVLVGIAVMFAGGIFHFIFYRCPHCNAYLDRSYGEFCPHCGKKLDE